MNSNAERRADSVRRFASPVDIRDFRLTHALQAIENALMLLESRPAEGIEISALERVRDDLAVVLRTGT